MGPRTIVTAFILGGLRLLNVETAIATVLLGYLQERDRDGYPLLPFHYTVVFEDLIHEVHLRSPLEVTLLLHVYLRPEEATAREVGPLPLLSLGRRCKELHVLFGIGVVRVDVGSAPREGRGVWLVDRGTGLDL